MRAAAEMGIRTVAIYSNEDRFALHRFKADESYLVGEGGKPIAAYLDIDDIIRIAREAAVDAIHPGYGFLSENPVFARACAQAGITFIGPTPELLELLGDKTAARRLAQSAGVPVLPGAATPVKSPDEARKLAQEIGYPVIIKAAMGGGGRGMRVARDRAELLAGFEAARREAKAAFGDPTLFLERYIENPKHIEVQIYRSMLESQASEMGSRMTAMDSATRNARDMIERLTLKFNKQRQAAITKEISEIVGGAEALK